MTNTQKAVPQPNAIEAALGRFYDRVDGWSKNQRVTYGVGALVLVLLLTVASSVPLWQDLGLRWVATVIAAPAGVLLFFLGLGFVHSTSLKEWRLFRLKELFPPRVRLIYVTMGLLTVGTVLIFSTAWLPMGVGGVVVIATALTVYNTIRRSPDELKYAQLGLPDPREVRILQEAEEEAGALLENEDGTVVLREDER